jgi:CRISPR-associated protein Csx10
MKEEFLITIKLESEAIFGSGYSNPSTVDLDVVSDDYGMVYMKAKTFKGNLRDSLEEILKSIDDGSYLYLVDDLFGKSQDGLNQWQRLKFSDMKLPSNVRKVIIDNVNRNILNPQEIKESLTDIRSFTSIDADGRSRDKSLRQMRVIKKGLQFEVEVLCEKELTNEEKGALAIAVKNLRHIGSMRTRGKGEIDCSLYEKKDNKYEEITFTYIENFLSEVK